MHHKQVYRYKKFICHRLVLVLALCSYVLGSVSENGTTHLISPHELMFYVYALISTFLACFAGLCSGLTVGYMSISKADMQLLSNSDNEQYRRIGTTILSILNNHHLLLSTLLLSNALALYALPIFLHNIVPSYLTIIISTIAVVVFGYVLPQAYCTGPAKIVIGYMFSPFVRMLQVLLYLLVQPITYVLDNWLGHHYHYIVLNTENLKTILFLHNSKEYGYRPYEIRMLQNTIDLRLYQAKQSMIPIETVFMVSEEAKLDKFLLERLEKYCYSKVPVYAGSRTRVVGYIKLKNLLGLALDGSMIKETKLVNQVPQLKETDNLLEAIDVLKGKNTSIAVVVNEQGFATGVLPLKNIFYKVTLQEFKDDDYHLQYRWDGEEGIEAKEQD